MRRALVLSGGGLRGAYDSGAVVTLMRSVGPQYFDTIYASSIGTLTAPFVAAHQPDAIEYIWKTQVSGTKLVDLSNMFSFTKKIIDYDKLLNLFQKKGRAHLDVKEIFSNKTKLCFTLINVKTKKLKYFIPKKKNIFLALKAGVAVNHLQSPVVINGVAYLDAALYDTIPVKKALADGYDEIIVITNKQKRFTATKAWRWFIKLFLRFFSPIVYEQVMTYDKRLKDIQKILNTNKKVKTIQPKRPLVFTDLFDTNHNKIIRAFRRGKKDAKKFLKKYYF